LSHPVSDLLVIEGLGQRGDGVARTPAGTVHMPFALPGETVEAAVDVATGRGRVLRVVTPSPDRADPVCTLFGLCGGCAMQHVGATTYLAWKRDLVRHALTAGGIEIEVEPCVDAHGAGRRRVTLHARRSPNDALVVGFSEARSHTLVPVAACPVIVASLEQAFPAMRAVAELLTPSGKPLDLAATATLTGIDLDIRGHGPVGSRQRLTLIDMAAAFDLARLSVHGEVLVERRAPQVLFGTALVTPPAGGFLQATEAGEHLLGKLVTAGIGKAKRVADLFSGCGTFALRLAERAAVHAVEADKGAVAAIDLARRHTKGLKAVTTEVRDLFRRPLHKLELAAYDAVVFDPPRAGAEAQARLLASSAVPTVVAVSCAPATLARDLRILVDGGYRLVRVTPVDQFRHSAHVETVAVLTKGRR
jgi:23S rRNA (uracil1939-C5)-methyltransferase